MCGHRDSYAILPLPEVADLFVVCLSRAGLRVWLWPRIMQAALATTIVLCVLFFVLAVYFFVAASQACQANPGWFRFGFVLSTLISMYRCILLCVCLHVSGVGSYVRVSPSGPDHTHWLVRFVACLARSKPSNVVFLQRVRLVLSHI